MGRLANDGRGRLGGRTKGTPNKPQAPLNEWVHDLINANRSYISQLMKTPYTEQGVNVLAALLIVSAVDNLTATLAALQTVQETTGGSDENAA